MGGGSNMGHKAKAVLHIRGGRQAAMRLQTGREPVICTKEYTFSVKLCCAFGLPLQAGARLPQAVAAGGVGTFHSTFPPTKCAACRCQCACVRRPWPPATMAATVRNYRVRSKLEVFYTGGPARLSADGKLLACACADEVKVGQDCLLSQRCLRAPPPFAADGACMPCRLSRWPLAPCGRPLQG